MVEGTTPGERNLQREREEAVDFARGIILAAGVCLVIWTGVAFAAWRVCLAIVSALT